MKSSKNTQQPESQDQQELGQLSMNVENDNTNKENYSEDITHYKVVEGTPFGIVKKHEQYILTLGNYLITEPYQSAEEIENLLLNKDWNILVQIIGTVAEIINSQTIKK